MSDLGPATGHARDLPGREPPSGGAPGRAAGVGWGKRLCRGAVGVLAVGLAASCSNGAPNLNWSGRVVVTAAAYQVPGSQAAPASTAVLTQRGSASRVGWNSDETTLNQHNVNASDFGKRVAYPVDGKIYAQPLFVPGLRVDGRVHNVVIVATEADSVYAFDADAAGAPPAPLWHTSFLVHGAVAVNAANDLTCTSIAPTVGITGTPVIDPATDTMYLIATMKVNGQIVDYLHALSITTGRDRMRPVQIQASVHGTGMGSTKGIITFSAFREQQHMGLLLDHGVVYAGFSSYCGHVPYHGWVLGYQASDLHQVVVYNDTRNSWGGGIWQSATGLAADAAGNIYFITGNGPFDLNAGGPDAGDTVLEMRPGHGTLAVVQYFTPFYQACLAEKDQDYGSGAPLLLPNEIIAIGKEGAIAVINRSGFGGYHTIRHPCSHMNETDVDHVIQELPPQTAVGGIWSAETTWTGPSGQYVYTAGQADHLKAWHLVNGKLVGHWTSRAHESLVYPGGIPVGSSDGGNPASAIVWILDQEHGPALRAYSASNVSDELYNTQQDAARDGIPGYDNFCVPTVADGHVFVGTTGELLIYGLLH
jgi:hypothetical protein